MKVALNVLQNPPGNPSAQMCMHVSNHQRGGGGTFKAELMKTKHFFGIAYKFDQNKQEPRKRIFITTETPKMCRLRGKI